MIITTTRTQVCQVKAQREALEPPKPLLYPMLEACNSGGPHPVIVVYSKYKKTLLIWLPFRVGGTYNSSPHLSWNRGRSTRSATFLMSPSRRAFQGTIFLCGEQ